MPTSTMAWFYSAMLAWNPTGVDMRGFAAARGHSPRDRHHPEFVVLDEPTSALTPEATAEIITLLSGLSQRLGLSYLFISHDLTTVDEICHRVAVMYLGQIVEIGTKEQVFATPLHLYTRALLAAHLFPDLATRRVDRAERPLLRGEIPGPIDPPKGCCLYGRCPSQVARCQTVKQALAPLPPAQDDGRICWRHVGYRTPNLLVPSRQAMLSRVITVR